VRHGLSDPCTTHPGTSAVGTVRTFHSHDTIWGIGVVSVVVCPCSENLDRNAARPARMEYRKKISDASLTMAGGGNDGRIA
jgi:GTP cyclohydrolase FolE2